jgi:hypothetical protein
MKLVITIDTEEDNWGNYTPKGYTLKNILRIPVLQDLFDEFDVIPTYLVTYPVATDIQAIEIFRKICGEERCEIGMHCHPWNTPPFEEENNERNSMLCNLPGDLQFRKMAHLHKTIIKNFNTLPVSFRSGRWGYNKEVAKALYKLGYKVDSSVLSFIDWTHEQGPDFSKVFPEPYRFNPEEIFKPDSKGQLLEIPATIGFNKTNFKFSNDLFNFLRRSPINRFRLIGLLDKLTLLKKIWLSPEQSTASEMIALTKVFIKKKAPVINLFFHSPTLLAGLTPFVRTEADQLKFIARIREFLLFIKEAGIPSVRLSETGKEILS